ncbi:hypothetical protein GQ457_07G030760 [Hibiscus cannabinus]
MGKCLKLERFSGRKLSGETVENGVVYMKKLGGSGRGENRGKSTLEAEEAKEISERKKTRKNPIGGQNERVR